MKAGALWYRIGSAMTCDTAGGRGVGPAVIRYCLMYGFAIGGRGYRRDRLAPMRVALAVVAVFLVAAPALADTPEGVRQRLIAAKLSPDPLFPTYVPTAWQSARASLGHRGPRFNVVYTKCCDAAGAYTLIVSFSRERYRALDDELRLVRLQRHHFRKTRVGSRRVYLFHEDTEDGYVWHEQHLTYLLLAHNGVIGRPSAHLMARVVASVAPLR